MLQWVWLCVNRTPNEALAGARRFDALAVLRMMNRCAERPVNSRLMGCGIERTSAEPPIRQHVAQELVTPEIERDQCSGNEHRRIGIAYPRAPLRTRFEGVAAIMDARNNTTGRGTTLD